MENSLKPVCPVYFSGKDKVNMDLPEINTSFLSEYDFLMGDATKDALYLSSAKQKISSIRDTTIKNAFLDCLETQSYNRKEVFQDMIYSYAFSNVLDITMKLMYEYLYNEIFSRFDDALVGAAVPPLKYIKETISSTVHKGVLFGRYFAFDNMKRFGNGATDLSFIRNEMIYFACSSFSSIVYSAIYSEIIEIMIANLCKVIFGNRNNLNTVYEVFCKECYDKKPDKDVDAGIKYTFISSILREMLENYIVNYRTALTGIAYNIANLYINDDTFYGVLFDLDQSMNPLYQDKINSILNLGGKNDDISK